MSEPSSDDIQIDFINELKSYIPALRDKASSLKGVDSEDSDKDLAELHRLVHTIRGASSIVKLSNLSKVASEFEQVIEEIISERLTIDADVFKAILCTIEYFEAYSREIPCNDSFGQKLRTEVLGSLLEVRNFATVDDGHDLLSQLLVTANQDEDDTLVLDTEELAFDDIDLEADDLLADEIDFPAAIEYEHFANEGYAFNNAPQSQEDTTLSDSQNGEDDGSELIDLPLQELLESFYQEAEDHLQDLGKALGKLEEHISFPVSLTSEYKELLGVIRRSVHTIKGAAAVIKLKAIAGWGHEFEDVLDWLYEEADVLTPAAISVIADAADMLERFVTVPQKVDPGKLEQLRSEFKRIIGSDLDTENIAENEPVAGISPMSADYVDLALPVENQGQSGDCADRNAFPNAPSLGLDQAKTLRVDMTKVESLVNLASELTIALSGFDQDMEGLGNQIGEIDRARLRLKKTSRDLELGYEVKAIQKLGSAQSMLQTSAAATGEDTAAFSDFDLLELDRYSELNLIIRSLSETAVDVSTISRQLSDIHSGFDAYLNRLRILLSELHQKTMRMRMTPMSTVINRMRRTVRETATQLDKRVQLTVQGEHIELDKMVWEKLADPLMHLLRNAVDHGIESPAARQTAGKPEIAAVHLAAAYQGNQVVIRVTDDGRGLEYEAIRKAVASSQPGKDVDAMSEEDLADMIFQPGFSTCQTISEVSGRGVGLDVVKKNILGLKGSVRIAKSSKGAGTTFRINLPLTMAVMQALLFDVGGQLYATALYDIKEILRVNPEDLEGQGEKTINMGDRSLPFYKLSESLANVVPRVQTGNSAQRPLVLIVDTDSWQGAVAIDRIYSQKEIVIKNLGTHLRKVKGIAGATVMGDGKVVPILNLEELLRVESIRHHKMGYFKQNEIQKPLEIMVVDDSVSVRMVVARLMQRQGWKVHTANDGVEAIELLHTRRPDLIVLDVEMPRMNGYEFMSSMRAQTKFNDTPVIMLTSRTSKKHREKAQALGVDGFVTKPYGDEEFVDLVKQLTQR